MSHILLTGFQIDDSDIRIRKGDTDAAGLAHSQQRIGNAERGCFAHTPAFAEVDAHIPGLIDKLRGHGPAAAVEKTQFFSQFHFLGFGMIDDGIDHGRHGREKGDFFEISQNPHELIDFKARHQDLGGTVKHAPV